MISAGNDGEVVIVDGVDQAVGVVDATGPEAGQVLTQGFGLAEPGKGCTERVGDQAIDAPQGLLVLVLPVEVVAPGRVGPREAPTHPEGPAPRPPHSGIGR